MTSASAPLLDVKGRLWVTERLQSSVNRMTLVELEDLHGWTPRLGSFTCLAVCGLESTEVLGELRLVVLVLLVLEESGLSVSLTILWMRAILKEVEELAAAFFKQLDLLISVHESVTAKV